MSPNADTQEEPAPLPAVGASRRRDRRCGPAFPPPPAPLSPACRLPVPTARSSPPPQPLIISPWGLGPLLSFSLFNSSVCLSFLTPVLTPLPPCPPSLSSPHLFSPQTFLASSGGLYCLGGGCGNVVIPGCMSLPSTPASPLPCSPHAQAWPRALHGEGPALRASSLEQAP